jgi:rhomboid protease GluP
MDIVLLIIGLNVLAFILPYIWDFGGGRIDSHQALLSMGWKNNADIQDGEYYRFLTSTFLHADLPHLFFNMYSLWSIGPSIVSIFGTPYFAVIYLISGLSGSLFSYLFNPNVPSVGASGAIFGLVGALLSYAITRGESDLLANLFLIIFINVVYGFASGGRIDNWGHLGGFVAGLVLGFILLSVRFG